MPSPVSFLAESCGTREPVRERGPTEPLRDWVGKGEGRDDVDVLAGVLRRPRGSLRFDTLDRSKIEPDTPVCQPIQVVKCNVG